jgi:Animal haem peroxidase
MANPDYRTMFPDLEPFYPRPEDLSDLAILVSGTSATSEASDIPAGYTYLAQFITHDISYEEDTDRFFASDQPWDILNPDVIEQIRNLRRPNFDLETIYGYSDPTNRDETPRRDLVADQTLAGLPLLNLGLTIGVDDETAASRLRFLADLQRGVASVSARIVDPRNDENLLLAQTQVVFTHFHNALVVWLRETHTGNLDAALAKKLFDKARKLAIRYYQTIVLTDFLPRIVQVSVLEAILDGVKPSKLFYQPELFIPTEFSAAAFRFGHSMIKEKYDLNVLNAGKGAAELDNLLTFTGPGVMGSTPGTPILSLPSLWIIDWYRFYDLGKSPSNFAERINTELPSQLRDLLPAAPNSPKNMANSLPALDLFRGRRLGLPSGQDIARRMGTVPLEPKEICWLIDQRVIDTMKPGEVNDLKAKLKKAFSEQTPLWFYLLAEAELRGNGRLGEVGSRIIAETMIALLLQSEYSILQEPWDDDEGKLLENGKFSMPTLLRFVRAMGEKHHDDLYPDGPDVFDAINPLGDSGPTAKSLIKKEKKEMNIAEKIEILRQRVIKGEVSANALARDGIKAMKMGMQRPLGTRTTEWAALMGYITDDADELTRLCGLETRFNESRWGLASVAYIGGNSLCTSETVTATGTLRAMSIEMIKNLDATGDTLDKFENAETFQASILADR